MKSLKVIVVLALLVFVVAGKVGEAKADLVTDYFSGTGTYTLSTDTYDSSGNPNATPSTTTTSSIFVGEIDFNQNFNSSFIGSLNVNIYNNNKLSLGYLWGSNVEYNVISYTDNANHTLNNNNTYNANLIGDAIMLFNGSQRNQSLSFQRTGNNGSFAFSDNYQGWANGQTGMPSYMYENLTINNLTFSDTPVDINQVPTPTPIPAAFYLLGSGLVELFGFRKRKA